MRSTQSSEGDACDCAMPTRAQLGVSADELTVDELQAATALLRGARQVAVVGHVRPDADAVGSVSAGIAFARACGAEATGFIDHPGGVARNLATIPLHDAIRFSDPIPSTVDTVLVVDCGDLGRAGSHEAAIRERGARVIVVDHHDGNPGGGGVNLIAPRADSTTTLLWLWAQEAGIEVTPTIAHALYAGLVTDTGGFRWGGHDSAVGMHLLAAELAGTGIDTGKIRAELMDAMTASEAAVLGALLSRLETLDATLEGQKCRSVVLMADNSLLAQAPAFIAERAVDLTGAIEGSDMLVVAKEQQPNVWHVSLRSPRFDVATIARRVGGGGHVRAAGFTVTGSARECRECIEERVLRDC